MEQFYLLCRVVPEGLIYLSGSRHQEIEKDDPEKGKYLWRPLFPSLRARDVVSSEASIAFLSPEGRVGVLDPSQVNTPFLTYLSLELPVRTLSCNYSKDLLLLDERSQFWVGTIPSAEYIRNYVFPVCTVKKEFPLPPLSQVKYQGMVITETGLLYERYEIREGGIEWHRIDLPPLKEVAYNYTYNYTLALTKTGQIYQRERDKDSFLPFILPSKISRIAVGWYHGLILTEKGTLYAQGGNYCGQLGLNDFVKRKEWTRVKKIPEGIKEVITGLQHSFLLTKDNKVYATGDNHNGRLGLERCNNRRRWELVPVRLWKINTGSYYAVGLA